MPGVTRYTYSFYPCFEFAFEFYLTICRRALDAYNKCLNLAPLGWLERGTTLGNRAAVLVMMNRYALPYLPLP
jgi:hypothetical protein